MAGDVRMCRECGATSAVAETFCPHCGRRLTCVKPQRRIHRVLGVLASLRPADPLGQNPRGVGEAYKHAPLNHSFS
jgi:hypothetical protein